MARKAEIDVFRPNRQEIKNACQEIQKQWTDEERSKRERYVNPNPVEIPSIAVVTIERP